MPEDLRYYSRPRSDIIHMIPGPVRRALEIGCGVGNTLMLLKEAGLIEWAGGVEIMPEAAAKAAAEEQAAQEAAALKEAEASIEAEKKEGEE